MPQGRRKTPFSGKAKKVQLKEKKERNELKPKFGEENTGNSIPFSTVADNAIAENDQILTEASKSKSDLLMEVPSSTLQSKTRGGKRVQNEASRYELRFTQESKSELAAKREHARQPLKKVDQNDLELGIDEYFPESLDFPIRPAWNSSMPKTVMEANEAKYFREYVEAIFDKHEETDLSFFELNLETWRQLWRVIEKSDILLLVVDARYPTAMFPPSLYSYVISLKKHFMVVLNKVDLIPAGLALAWKDYFQRRFPDIHITFFTSCPTYNLVTGSVLTGEHAGLKFRKLRGTISMVTDGAKQIFEVCKKIVATGQINIGSQDLAVWENKIQKSAKGEYKISAEDESLSEPKSEIDTEFTAKLTIGMLGQPNAGKSSLINSLMGKRVVSVSKTPGHTKHFQTIFITKLIVLCDCPGLVFPSLVPRQLQVLLGSYPISQVKEPFSIIRYIAERLDISKLLKISHPDNQVNTFISTIICNIHTFKKVEPPN